ncbi:hotdog domain-containing protein [Micromonospora profundi]|uniref:thioesterase family protein n=1 Tax=Micromonospora profundi TaxID=1420889 RepID=UPI002FF0E2F8
MLPIDVGTSATHTHVVQAADCATNWGNDLPVLATPVLLWLAEITAMRVVEDHLAEGEMTVGYGHTATHLAATPQGWTVRLHARLTRVDKKLLHFEVTAEDDRDVVFTGEHIRAVVDRARFVERLDSKALAGPVAR